MDPKRSNAKKHLNYGAMMALASTPNMSEGQQATWRAVTSHTRYAVNKGVSDGRFAARRALLKDFVSDDGHTIPKETLLNSLLNKGYGIYSHGTEQGWFRLMWVLCDENSMNFFDVIVDKTGTSRQKITISHERHRLSTERTASSILRDSYVFDQRVSIQKSQVKEVFLAIKETAKFISVIINIAKKLRDGDHQNVTVKSWDSFTYHTLQTPGGSLAYSFPGGDIFGDGEFAGFYERFETKVNTSPPLVTSSVEDFLTKRPPILKNISIYEKISGKLTKILRDCHVENLE